MAPKAAKAPANLLAALERVGLSGRGLRAAIGKGNVSAVRAILESTSGANVASKVFEDGKWPLHSAIELLGKDELDPEAVVDIISTLLERKASANQSLPPLNESPLQIALRLDALPTQSSSRWHLACTNVVVKLLESRADPKHVDDMGEGPLAEAAVAGNVDAVRVLVARGACPQQKNLDGKCPLELDIPSNVREMLEKVVDMPAGSAAVAGGEEEDGDEGRPAAEFFDMGNKHFMAERYTEARQCYSKALIREPENALFSESKVAVCMVLGDFVQGLADSSSAVRREADNGFVHEQCARCLLMSNRLAEAHEFCHDRMRQMTSEDLNQPDLEWRPFLEIADRIQKHADDLAQIDLFLNDTSRSADNNDASRLFSLLADMLQPLSSKAEKKSAWARRLRLGKVRMILLPLAGQSRQSEQKRTVLAREALQESIWLAEDFPGDPDVLYWMACSLLSMSRRREALEGLRAARPAASGKHAASESLLRNCIMVQNHQEKGQAALENQEYEVALEHFDAAMSAYFTGDVQCLDRACLASLLCSRSATLQKHATSADTNSALDDVMRALELKPSHAQAFFQRAQIYMDLQKYQSAQCDFEKLEKLEPGFPGLSEARTRAQVWANKPPKQNYYAVLGVGFDASSDSIKKAYKAAALKWHPDKNPGDENAEKNFMNAQEAFEVLSDPRRKFEYDGFEKAPLTHTTFFGANFGVGGQFNNGQFNSISQSRSGQASGYPASEVTKKPTKALAQGTSLDFKGWSFTGAKSCLTHAGER